MTIKNEDKEYLDIVDGNNNVIGKETRANIHKQMLFHRAVHIIVLNTKGEMFIQKRSAIKDTYPNHWDVSSAGHLNVGEGYESAAKRELREELGIENIDLEYVSEIKGSKATDFEFIKIFRCIYDGEITINNEEISEGKFIGVNKLKKLLRSKSKIKLTPAIKNIIINYL